MGINSSIITLPATLGEDELRIILSKLIETLSLIVNNQVSIPPLIMSGTYTQSEVQALADQVQALVSTLQTAKVLS